MKQIKNWKEIHRTQNYEGHPQYVFEIEGFEGYRVHVEEQVRYLPGGMDFRIESTGEDYNNPAIFISASGNVQKARVQTISYGSVDQESLDVIIQGFLKAKGLIAELSKQFPECFQAV